MISQTAEYALRAVVYLAANKGTPTNRKNIAEASLVPLEYLTKVMQELARAGIVEVQRGPGGGYRLASEPTELSVYDVIAAVSELPRITACPLGIASHVDLCPLHRKLDEAAALVENAFRDSTIADLVPDGLPEPGCQFPQTPPSTDSTE